MSSVVIVLAQRKMRGVPQVNPAPRPTRSLQRRVGARGTPSSDPRAAIFMISFEQSLSKAVLPFYLSLGSCLVASWQANYFILIMASDEYDVSPD